MIAFYTMCFVGGFFGMFAIVETFGSLASAETANLIEVVYAFCRLDFHEFFVRFSALILYILAILFSYLLNKKSKFAGKVTAVFIDAAASIFSAFLLNHGVSHKIFFLMPVFFAMAFQWLSFGELNGFVTASIFSTNNLRQAITALIDRNKKKFFTYFFNLVFFHLGVVYYFFLHKIWATFTILSIIPVLVFAFFVIICSRRSSHGNN